MDEQLKAKLKRLIEYKGLPYRLRVELEKGEITKELLLECTYYLDKRKLFEIAQDILYSLSEESRYRKEDKSLPKPRFPKNKWHEKINRNFTLALDQRIKEHGDITDLAKILSSSLKMSQRQMERYLNGETKLTAEVILLCEEILDIHRDEILGELATSEIGPQNVNDIKEFRVLFELMRTNEMVMDDLKDILNELFKLYSELRISPRNHRLFDRPIDIARPKLIKKFKQININLVEYASREVQKAMEEIKRETTT